MIQNKRANMQVIGHILNKPELIMNGSCELTVNDFPESIHRVLFLAINNLLQNSVENITPVTIDSYLASYPTQYKVFQDNKGVDLCNRLMKATQHESFEYWYQTVKKFTLLRELDSAGFDITPLYNKNEIEPDKIEQLNEKINKMTLEDMMNYFNDKLIKVREKCATNLKTSGTFKASEGMRELKEKLKVTPSMGHSFVNPVLTTAFRGMRKKKFALVSGSTGSGKSRTQMANAVHVATPWLYDTKKNQWIKRNEESKPVLYISTELEEDEIQTVMIAYLSGVNEDHILNGVYADGEEERVDKAIDILEESPLFCQCISDFDIADIQMIMERMIISHGAEYVFFDYLHSTPKILQYYNQKTGTRLAEHQILYLFSNSLKELVNRYDVFLYASTQLNRNYKDEGNLDASAIRGAMSVADKVDMAMISLPPSEKDLELLEDLIERKFGVEPNMCHTIYKNRGNKYKNIRIWTKINLGNVREEILFVTDDRYRTIEIEETYIETI